MQGSKRTSRSLLTLSVVAVLGLVAGALVNIITADVPRWLRSSPFALAFLAVAAVVLGVWLQHRRPAQALVLRRVSATSFGPDGMKVVAVTDSGAVVAATCRQNGTWSEWADLGAPGRTSDVAVIAPRREVTEYYAVDVDGTLRMTSHTRDRAASWRIVGRSEVHGKLLRIAAVTMNMLGEHRELFGVTATGRGVHAWSTNKNGWSGWHEMWGSGGVDVAVSSPRSGLMDCFLVDHDGVVWHRWYWEGWSEWERWGRSGAAAVAVSSYRQAGDRQEMFAVTTHGDLVHRWHDGGWSDWHQMEGPEQFVDVAGTTNADRPHCLAVDVDGVLWHRHHDVDWSEWRQVPAVARV